MKWIFPALAFALVILSSSSIAGDEVNKLAAADFASYCASCHGVDGTGNGPLADSLKKRPTDLTLITKNNDGKFPYTLLRKTIEGTESRRVREHGLREMPVWGPVFQEEPESVVPGGGASGFYGVGAGQCIHLAARARILSIVDYIASIQK